MRFSLTAVPSLLLPLLVMWVAFAGWGILKALLALVTLFVIRLVFVNMRLGNTRYNPAAKNKIVLNSLPISHYVEKVRWCLDYAGIAYEEEQDVGIIGFILFGRTVPTLEVPSKGVTIGNSADILRYLYATNLNNGDVGKFLEPTEEAVRLETMFDKFAIANRRLAYKDTLSMDNSDEVMKRVWSYYQRQVPTWQKWLLVAVLPVLKLFIRKVIGTESEADIKWAMDKVEETLKEVNQLLSDGRKFLLNTDTPTYVDFTFAALAGLTFDPKEYGGNALHEKTRVPVEMLGPKGAKEAKKLRETPAGKFVLRMYKDYRHTCLFSD